MRRERGQAGGGELEEEEEAKKVVGVLLGMNYVDFCGRQVGSEQIQLSSLGRVDGHKQ